jgi:hypothetical protein
MHRFANPLLKSIRMLVLVCTVATVVCGWTDGAVSDENSFTSIVRANAWEGAATIETGQLILSPSHNYSMSLQPGCQLKIFEGSDETVRSEIWSSNSAVENQGCFLRLENDGNLAVHRLGEGGQDDVVWQTGPDRYTPSGSHFLVLQDNGDLVVYAGTPAQVRGKMWSVSSGVIKQHEMGFRLVGGASGPAFFAAIDDLASNKDIGLIPVRIDRGDGPIAAMQRAYHLPGWMTIPVLGTDLCIVANAHVCYMHDDKQHWLLRPSESDVPKDACRRTRSRAARSNFICVPDIEVRPPSTVFVTRRFTPEEAQGTPQVVTQNTRGCEAFNRRCQIQILTRNTRQSDAWKSADASGVLTSNNAKSDWWIHLTGTVTLPAITFDVVVNSSDPSLPEITKCLDIQHSVEVADFQIRRSGSPGLRPGSDATTVISADCYLTNLTSDAPSRAQSFGGPIQVPSPLGVQLEHQWRSIMHWSIATEKMNGADGEGMMVGVWDGSIAENRSTFVRDKTTFFQFKAKKGADAGANVFTEGNVISWIDSVPKTLGEPPKGPCGAYVEYTAKSHATVIAGMMSGDREGVTKKSRLWVHEWTSDRIQGNLGPAKSLAWFTQNVADGDKIFEVIYSPYVANLSCDASDDRYVEALKRDVAGVSQSKQSQDVAPYVVSVAAGNRETDAFLFNAPDAHVGYASLARDPVTAGFISVVALGPAGDDVLRCRDIRSLLNTVLRNNALLGKPISDWCPAANSSDSTKDSEPLVKFGAAFDVAAIGLGVGPALDSDDAVVMWGSSFAAPRVATLALQILSKTHLYQVLLPGVRASAVADRIRFTTDKLNGSIALYGVINAERALGFENDIVEIISPEDPENQSWEQSLEKPWVNTCLRNNGVVRISRANQRNFNYPLDGKAEASLNLGDIFRLRRDDPSAPGLFEAMLISGKDPPGSPIKKVNLGGRMIPVECSLPTGSKVKLKQSIPMPSNYIRSVTKCSFVKDCV